MRPDPNIVSTFLRYARLLAARGYVHNTLGNIVMRASHPDHPHGVAYTKHAELSLEEMEADNIVITDIPTSRVLYGERDRKSTRLNSSHSSISYAVFCLKKKNRKDNM